LLREIYLKREKIMPEKVLRILKAALENYHGEDPAEIAEVRNWLDSIDEKVIVLNQDELAELKLAITESEKEEAQAIGYSLEEVDYELDQIITESRSRKVGV
jgi:hypothetical protein